MQPGRTRLVTLLGGAAALAVAAGLPVVQPASAEPTLPEVRDRVDTLYRQAEQASEKYNDARLELADIEDDLTVLRADQRRQDRALDKVRTKVEAALLREYQQRGVSTVGQVMFSGDPSRFLEQLSTMSAYNDLQSDLFADYRVELRALQVRRAATQERADELAAVKTAMAKAKDRVDDRYDAAQDLLDDLEADERAEVVPTRSDSRDVDVADVPVSGRAKAAVAYALAQVGDSYVYGAAGPDAFDCSGLTMMAWQQAGVSLSHSSSAQMGEGTPVALNALQPGDLVFYYSPVSHVGLYIGGGKIVDAANPGTGVRITGVTSMPFSGAVRPG